MNGYGYGDPRDGPMRNGFHGGIDPYRRDDPYREELHVDLNSPRRSIFGGSMYAYSDYPTMRDDFDKPDFGRSQRNGFGPDIDMDDMRVGPLYELDHLATFSSKSGAMHAEDGLRKLRNMEQTTGIWTMRCSLAVERKCLVIIDKGNGEELERFPIELVHDPTAIFKDDRREIYTNLILFTVLEDPRRRGGQADMHIFQSITAPAQQIVDDIQAVKEGRARVPGPRIPPPPMGPAPDPPRFNDEHKIELDNLPAPPPEILGHGSDLPAPPPENLGFGGGDYSEEGIRYGNERSNRFNVTYGYHDNFDYSGPSLARYNDKPVVNSNYDLRETRDFRETRDIRELRDTRDKDFHMNNLAEEDINMRMTRGGGGMYGGPGPNRASYIPQGNDLDGGQNEVLERDVQLLNSCFDDIEKFVSRLQQAAEAYKELERRKRDRSAKKNKQPRDGMLNMRARPPPADDFIDIFQKFKYAFNLLAKLKAHIHDPNAPELVHFLFTPLSLIYEASRDPVHGGRDLADSASKPAITTEARQLLLNCLTSKELELWTSLGKSWTGSREDMRDYSEPYVPKFYNGWIPSPNPPMDSRMDNRMFEDAVANQRRQVEGRYNETQARNEANDMIHPYNSREAEYNRYAPTKRYDEYDNYEDSPYAKSTKRPSTPPLGAITNPNVARYQEHVERHIDRNREVHKPRQDDMYKQPLSREEENLMFAQDVLRSNGSVMECVHDREGRNSKELSVKKGDLLQVLDDSRNWWKMKNCHGQIGHAPYTILKEYQPSNFDADKIRARRSSGDYSSNIPTNGGPSSNHYIPVAPPVPSSTRRQDSFSESSPRYNGYDQDRKERRKSGESSPRYNGYDPDRKDRRKSSGDDSKHRRRNDSFGDDYSSDSERNYRHEDRRNRRDSDDSNNYDRRGRDRPRQREDDRGSGQDRRPPPSAPPPPPVQKRPPRAPAKPALKKTKETSPRDDLRDELNKRMSSVNMDNRQIGVTTKINSTSSIDDVKDWLINKGFSKRCQQVLSGYNGEDVFRMKKREMERLVGPEEAHRLESMVLVQKNKAGYKTQSAAELNRILQKRKQRAESSNYNPDMGMPPSFHPDSPDYSDADSDSSDDLTNAGKTLRALLQHQRKRIYNHKYADNDNK